VANDWKGRLSRDHRGSGNQLYPFLWANPFNNAGARYPTFGIAFAWCLCAPHRVANVSNLLLVSFSGDGINDGPLASAHRAGGC